MSGRLPMRQRVLHWAVDRLLSSHYFNQAFRERNRELFVGAFTPRARDIPYEPLPQRYQRGSRTPASSGQRSSGGPVFVSARFRSGSTFLWNIFRHTPGVTAYYEPLNERRWFLGNTTHGPVDPTHLGVKDYWAEYSGMEDLNAYFDVGWTTRELYMDRYSCNASMETYIAELIERAQGVPVLQCNRFDFRLEWLRTVFPGCRTIVLYRDPREQWMSVQKGGPKVPPDYALKPDDQLDLFYGLEWARDLRVVFPMLDLREHRHPYSVHYMLWRLSYLHAVRHADFTLAYEGLIDDLDGNIRLVLEAAGLSGEAIDIERYRGLLSSRPAPRWPDYADSDWFEEIEHGCEAMLARFFRGN